MSLEGAMTGLEETRAKQVKAMRKQCLGALVGKFTGHLNSESRLEENDGASQKTVDAPWASFHFSVAMSPEQEADVRSGLAELVDMRNRLVHHFIEHFDISDVKDCRAATVYLDSCYQKIDAHLDALKAWALAQDALREETALLFQSPAFIARFMANIQPDASVTSTAHAAAESSAGLVSPDVR
jgi:hypothetical protein